MAIAEQIYENPAKPNDHSIKSGGLGGVEYDGVAPYVQHRYLGKLYVPQSQEDYDEIPGGNHYVDAEGNVFLKRVTGIGGNVPSNAQIPVLVSLKSRDREGYRCWMEENGVELPPELEDDPPTLARWLKEVHGASVRDDGRIELDRITPKLSEMIAGNSVVMYARAAADSSATLENVALSTHPIEDGENTEVTIDSEDQIEEVPGTDGTVFVAEEIKPHKVLNQNKKKLLFGKPGGPIRYAEWKTLGSGGRAMVDDDGNILAGCPGLEGHDVDELDETSEQRQEKQEQAEESGWTSAEEDRAKETWEDAKENIEDAQQFVVLTRVGDKMYAFEGDAGVLQDVSRVGDGESANFDVEDLDHHLERLVDSGHRVAVVDRTEDGEHDLESEVDPEAEEVVEDAREEAVEDVSPDEQRDLSLEVVGETPDGREIYRSGNLHFTRRKYSVTDDESHVILADADKLDQAWSKDESFYIPPGGGGAEIAGRSAGFANWVAKGGGDEDNPIEMSRVTIDESGKASFGDGRHRFSVMRDSGRDKIPVLVEEEDVERARQMLQSDEGEDDGEPDEPAMAEGQTTDEPEDGTAVPGRDRGNDQRRSVPAEPVPPVEVSPGRPDQGASRHAEAGEQIDRAPKLVRDVLQSMHRLRDVRKKGSTQTSELGDAYAREIYDGLRSSARTDEFGELHDLSDELGHGAIGYESPGGNLVMVPPKFKDDDWDVRYSLPGEEQASSPHSQRFATKQSTEQSEQEQPEESFPWEEQKPEQPKPRGVNPNSRVGRAIIEAVGDDPQDQAEMRQVVDDIWEQKQQEVAGRNDSLRNLLSNFGYQGRDMGAFVRALQKYDDPDQFQRNSRLGKRFDEMVDYAERYTPELLQYGVGESSSGDPKEALWNRLQTGLERPPARHSDEVIGDAMDLLTSQETSAAEHERRMAEDPEYRQEFGEIISREFARRGRKLRYFRRWCAARQSRWRKYARQLDLFENSERYAKTTFTEDQHPRATESVTIGGTTYTAGEFIPKDKADQATSEQAEKIEGVEPSSSLVTAKLHKVSYTDKKGNEKERQEWRMPGGEPLPEHLSHVKLPPGWSDVEINPDPDASVIARGKDAKGREQRVYSQAHIERQSAAKFSRVKEGIAKFDAMYQQNESNLSSDNPAVRESAAVQRLIMHTGIRPGSERDTGAEKRAYGATTLIGRHVHPQEDGTVMLEFTGKKGVDLSIPVTDKEIAKDLIQRAQQAGPDGDLFDVNDSQLRKYTKTLDGGGFKTKDFRTIKGTKLASELVDQQPDCCRSEKQYKEAVRGVAKQVASALGNTPTIALQSYIDPHVFSPWKESLAA